ncbi:transposase [Mesotoga prima]|uniref:transposase n=1 Tax=Mesotoga prima TaxID=1184387 RepID=UPI002FE05C92
MRPRSSKKDSDFKQKHSQTYSKRWRIERLFQKMKEVFRVEILGKEGRDDLYSRVTAIFLTLATLALSKFVIQYPILD